MEAPPGQCGDERLLRQSFPFQLFCILQLCDFCLYLLQASISQSCRETPLGKIESYSAATVSTCAS